MHLVIGIVCEIISFTIIHGSRNDGRCIKYISPFIHSFIHLLACLFACLPTNIVVLQLLTSIRECE